VESGVWEIKNGAAI